MCKSGILPCAGGGKEKKRCLIALVLIRPQMLVVDSRRETADGRRLASSGGGAGEVEEKGGREVWNPDKQREQCPHRFSPLTGGLPMHEFKAGTKPRLDWFRSDIHHVDQCCASTVLCPQ